MKNNNPNFINDLPLFFSEKSSPFPLGRGKREVGSEIGFSQIRQLGPPGPLVPELTQTRGTPVVLVRPKGGEVIFFDSHGSAWCSCNPEHLRAEPFGPQTFARQLTADEVRELGLSGDCTPYEAAALGGHIGEVPDGGGGRWYVYTGLEVD